MPKRQIEVLHNHLINYKLTLWNEI